MFNQTVHINGREMKVAETFFASRVKMMKMALFLGLLFFVLTPGVLLSLPPGGSRTTVALTHAVVFALVFTLTHKLVL